MVDVIRTLEVTVISAEDLSINGKPMKKKNTFVVVEAEVNSSNHHRYRVETKVDATGDEINNPIWNEKLRIDFPVQLSLSSLLVEVNCQSRSGNNTLIAAVKIPVSDFIEGYEPESYLHFLSYRLRDRYGERNGIINISVRVIGPILSSTTVSSTYNNGAPHPRAPEMMGFPIDCQGEHGGIVTGTPVSFRW